MAEEVVMLVAAEDFVAKWEGVEQAYVTDVTRVRSDDPRLEGIRHLFKPIESSFLDVESATAGPGERRGA